MPPPWSSLPSRCGTSSRSSRRARRPRSSLSTRCRVSKGLGLLKMDFLGLRNLSTIERALDLIEKRTGRADRHRPSRPSTMRSPSSCSSAATPSVCSSWKALRCALSSAASNRRASTTSSPSTPCSGRVPWAPTCTTSTPIGRTSEKPVEYPHPALEEFLRDTYGIIVYQEQVMQVAQAMASYTMAEADMLRKAMGKKVKSIMDAEKEKFVAGCVAAGHEPKLGNDLWDSVEPFAGYGFNKSHSAAYALVAYQTAWLKAHYPAEYMAALLTSTKKDKDRTAIYLSESRAMGIEVVVPTSTPPTRTSSRRTERSCSACRPSATWAKVSSRRSPNARQDGPFVRLPRLRRTGRHRGAEQADHRVAHQGRRVRQSWICPQRAPAGLRGHPERRIDPPKERGRRAVQPVRRHREPHRGGQIGRSTTTSGTRRPD